MIEENGVSLGDVISDLLTLLEISESQTSKIKIYFLKKKTGKLCLLLAYITMVVTKGELKLRFSKDNILFRLANTKMRA